MMDRTFIRFQAVPVFASVILFAAYASGQQSTPPPRSPAPEVASVPSTEQANLKSGLIISDKKSADGEKERNVPSSRTSEKEANDDVEKQLAAMKAENAEIREQLRRMAEGQSILIEQLDRLRRRLDRPAPSGLPTAVNKPIGASTLPDTPDGAALDPLADDAQPSNDAANDPTTPASANAKKADDDRYQDGIIIWKTSDDAKVPFLLRFNNNTQIRYLNTQSSPETFTDHLGVERVVNNRNDITVNRAMFILGGYIWDKRLRYSLTVWTSAGSNSIVVAGNIGWQFNRHLTVTGGYFGVPGSRSLVNTFPYFASTDRTMADNFFRPAFTQGVQVNGEIMKNWHYLALVGNGLNTLNITATKIDENLTFSGTTWWEPLGAYAPPGKSVNMYDDYFSQKKVRIRLGTSFTYSREDRFSNLDTASPENVSLHNSDGVLTFSTGAFAPGVTVQKALYRMWAVDWGLKYNGLAINGQYYSRWLSDFEADGPLPLTSTFDHGFDTSVGKFFVPKKLMGYVRGSMVFGHFNNSHEYGAGVKWHFLPTERLWFQAELMKVHRVPYGGTFTPYTAGMSGWVPMVQTVIGF
jgi:hypothetical protein